MDFQILYILIAVIIVLAIVFGTSYARKKGLVSADDLIFSARVLGLTASIIEELNLKQEPLIRQISNVVLLALDEAIKVAQGQTKDQIIADAEDKAYKLCEQGNITLTDNRKQIINQLIEIAINNKFGDELTK